MSSAKPLCNLLVTRQDAETRISGRVSTGEILRASEHGDAMSPFKFGHCCFDLGNCYLHGRGVIKDVDEWFRKAADQNRAKAQYNLAFA